jgi:hypothetical protein
MGSMGLPWGNAISDTGIDGSFSEQVWTVEVDTVPAPVIPGDRGRLDVTGGSEVIIVATATTIWIASVDIPISIVSRATSTRTADRGNTAIASRPIAITTTATGVRRSIGETRDIRRTATATAITVIWVWSTARTSTREVLIAMVRGITQSRPRNRGSCSSRIRSTNGR